MRDFTPAEIKEGNRLAALMAEHNKGCPECAACCEDEVCPEGQKLLKQFVAIMARS